MSFANPLGEFLRSFRQARGLTAMDVAQRCQIPVSVVLDIEHGDKPDADTMRTLSEGLAIPLVDLHRVAQGEKVELPAPTMLPAVPETVPAAVMPPVHDPFDEIERSPTILEAVRGLSPAQIEKVMDYIQMLKLAELGRKRSLST
ncbi:helix-turn-helix transcriptional regulator [bacterium]|nr:helix-turn-helix transcriptional regulator [bacterium]